MKISPIFIILLLLTFIILPIKSYADEIIEYFYSPQCKSCVEIKEGVLKNVKNKNIIFFNIDEKDNYDRLYQILNKTTFKIPVVKIGNVIYEGRDEVYKVLRTKDIIKEPNTLFVYFAGLVDGFNPCVITVYIFLISFLSFLGKNKRTIWLFGLLYALSVFVTNYAVGFGVFFLFSVFNLMPVFAGAIRILSISLILSFIIILILDLLKIYGFSYGIPIPLVKKMHNIVRNGFNNSNAGFFAIPIGALAAIIELPCSGIIYVPAMSYLALSHNSIIRDSIDLMIYNILFILPLIMIILILSVGCSSDILRKTIAANISIFKILGILILCIFLYQFIKI